MAQKPSVRKKVQGFFKELASKPSGTIVFQRIASRFVSCRDVARNGTSFDDPFDNLPTEATWVAWNFLRFVSDDEADRVREAVFEIDDKLRQIPTAAPQSQFAVA